MKKRERFMAKRSFPGYRCLEAASGAAKGCELMKTYKECQVSATEHSRSCRLGSMTTLIYHHLRQL